MARPVWSETRHSAHFYCHYRDRPSVRYTRLASCPQAVSPPSPNISSHLTCYCVAKSPRTFRSLESNRSLLLSALCLPQSLRESTTDGAATPFAKRRRAKTLSHESKLSRALPRLVLSTPTAWLAPCPSCVTGGPNHSPAWQTRTSPEDALRPFRWKPRSDRTRPQHLLISGSGLTPS